MIPVYAGAAKRPITPPDRPVFLAGFQPNRRATGVHDDLYVRTLALQVGDEPAGGDPPNCFVLAVCDVIGVLRQDVVLIREAVAQKGIDARALVVSSTHTHSGPDTIGLWGPSRLRSGVDRRYMELLRQQVAAAVAEAVDALQPARLWVGRADLTRWLRNARQPHIVDRELSVLQARTPAGPVFTLLNLACHPEVMFGHNTLITADYAGATCDAIEQSAGGVAVLATADIGGMMTPDVSRAERTFDTVEAMGRDVAGTALKALQAGRDLAPGKLHFGRRSVEIPVDNPVFRFAMAVGILPRPPRSRRHMVTETALLDLGDLRLVTVPGELFPETGMQLRQAIDVPYRFLIGLADDEIGYLLPAAEFVYPRNPLKPGKHYEETMSLSRHATPLLAEAWLALLAETPPKDR